MIKLVIFDLDGVIYRGERLIPGATQTVGWLKGRGASVAYLTNACTHSRKGRHSVLCGIGLDAMEDEVFPTSYAVAQYILDHYPKDRRNVFYVGESGVGEELELHGIRLVESEKADVVVAGLDRKFNYEKLAKASRAILRGADFIATNTDATYPMEDGLMPGAGAVVAAITCAGGKEPVVIGKPNTYILGRILKQFKVSKDETLIVGDRIETDIMFGKAAGLRTALVLTGVTRKEDLKTIKKSEEPDYILESVAELPRILEKEISLP